MIVTVDDDPSVSRAVARDLRRRYGERNRIVRAESGEQALDALRQMKLRGDQVAVILADYRMPGLTGIDFLERAMDIYPYARRVLLTAYADTSAAIDAINIVDLDHYLLKPWDPPEEKLYPVIDELLKAWQREDRKPVKEAKLIGHRWSAPSAALRDFLARNQVPYRWYASDTEEGERLLGAAGADGRDLPVLITAEGEPLITPTHAEVAAKVHLSTMPSRDFYDLVVVGGGQQPLAFRLVRGVPPVGHLVAGQELPDLRGPRRPPVPHHLGLRHRPVIRLQPRVQQRVDHRVQLLLRRVPRLEQVVVQVDHVDRVDRGPGIGVRGEQHPPRAGVDVHGLLEELDPVQLRHPVVGQDRGDQIAAQLHLPQRVQPVGRRLGPHDPVPVPVPPPQVAGHRPGYRRIVVDRQDRRAGFLGPLRQGVHDRLSIRSICDLFHIDIINKNPFPPNERWYHGRGQQQASLLACHRTSFIRVARQTADATHARQLGQRPERLAVPGRRNVMKPGFHYVRT